MDITFLLSTFVPEKELLIILVRSSVILFETDKGKSIVIGKRNWQFKILKIIIPLVIFQLYTC